MTLDTYSLHLSNLTDFCLLQLGSSFGASLCSLDLNGDGLDDIVVGAPLYTNEMDEGRVYVYVNREFVCEHHQFSIISKIIRYIAKQVLMNQIMTKDLYEFFISIII